MLTRAQRTEDDFWKGFQVHKLLKDNGHLYSIAASVMYKNKERTIRNQSSREELPENDELYMYICLPLIESRHLELNQFQCEFG